LIQVNRKDGWHLSAAWGKKPTNSGANNFSVKSATY